MFYHIKIGITGMTSWIEKNKSKEECLTSYVCPFINKEITLLEDEHLFNMSSFGYLNVYETKKPIDSDWPIQKKDFEEDDKIDRWRYTSALEKALQENSRDITSEIYSEAITLIDTGKYLEIRQKIKRDIIQRTSFFICPFDNKDIDHNYEFVVKPIVEKHSFSIFRADEINHTRTINEVIISQINKSTFIIADLTDARPNCYYEVGYAHSLGKPVIIIAKEGSERHFDISTYKWNYWNDYKDLKPTLEKEIAALINQLENK